MDPVPSFAVCTFANPLLSFLASNVSPSSAVRPSGSGRRLSLRATAGPLPRCSRSTIRHTMRACVRRAPDCGQLFIAVTGAQLVVQCCVLRPLQPEGVHHRRPLAHPQERPRRCQHCRTHSGLSVSTFLASCFRLLLQALPTCTSLSCIFRHLACCPPSACSHTHIIITCSGPVCIPVLPREQFSIFTLHAWCRPPLVCEPRATTIELFPNDVRATERGVQPASHGGTPPAREAQVDLFVCYPNGHREAYGSAVGRTCSRCSTARVRCRSFGRGCEGSMWDDEEIEWPLVLRHMGGRRSTLPRITDCVSLEQVVAQWKVTC